MEIPTFEIAPTGFSNGLMIKYLNFERPYSAILGVPHTHNFYTISILRAGRTVVYSDYNQFIVEAPALLLLRKDQIHLHMPETTSIISALSFLEWITIGLPPEWITLFDDPALPLSAEELSRIEHYLHLLDKEASVPGSERINNYLLSIIVQVGLDVKAQHAATTSNYTELYNSFIRSLNQNLRKEYSVNFYANEFHMTEKQLNNIVRKATGKTTKRIINESRLVEAKRLLYWRKQAIKEIAWALGFTSEAYFARFFKKYEGLSPSNFQNEVQKVK